MKWTAVMPHFKRGCWMGRLEKAKRNVFLGIVNKLVVILLEFISRKVFINYLGAELLGVNGVFVNLIQCLSLAELGINNVVAFSYYKPLACNDKKKLAALNSFYKKAYNVIAVIVAGIGILLIPFLDYIINTDIQIENLTYIYLLYLIDTVFSYFCVYKATVLNADQRGYVLSEYEMFFNTVRTIMQIVSLVLWKNFLIYLTIKIIFSVLTNFAKARQVDRDYPYINENVDLDVEEKKEIISTIKSGFIYKIASVLLNSTDNILISVLCGTVWVGLLSNYITISMAVTSFITIAFGNLTASIGNLVVEEDNKKKADVFNELFIVSNWLGTVCFCCTMLLCNDFVELWLGSEYIMDDSIVLPKIMMLYYSCVMQPIFSYREALGLYTKTKYSMLVAAGVNLVLSIIMGKIWGVSGILAASLLAVLFTYFWYEPVILYKQCFFCSAKTYFFQFFRNVIITALCYEGLKRIPLMGIRNNWMTWILKAVIYFTLSNLACFLLYRKSPVFLKLISKVKSKRK